MFSFRRRPHPSNVVSSLLHRGTPGEVLADALLDLARHPTGSGFALDALTRAPADVVRLDEAVRRAWWRRADTRFLLNGLLRGTCTPLGLALASTHCDGRVREAAVRRIVEQPSPGLMPFLVLRCADWVDAVRDAARAGLALLLHDDPATFAPAAAGAVMRLEIRSRGSFARAQLVAVASRWDVSPLLRSAERAVRRFAVEVGRFPLDALVRYVEDEGDVVARSRAAEAAVKDAVWRRRVRELKRLGENRFADVRVLAVVGLTRIGEEVEPRFLRDRSGGVRAAARAALPDVPFAEHYLSALPDLGAIEGLADLGVGAEAVESLLSHVDGRVRARALWASRRMRYRVPPADKVVPLLRDPSSAVVREAARTVGLAAVPPELPWDLLSDARPVVRRAGYRLLRQGTVGVRLRAALVAAVDPCPPLADRAATDVGVLAYELHRADRLPVTAGEAAELRDLLARSGVGGWTAELIRAALVG